MLVSQQVLHLWKSFNHNNSVDQISFESLHTQNTLEKFVRVCDERVVKNVIFVANTVNDVIPFCTENIFFLLPSDMPTFPSANFSKDEVTVKLLLDIFIESTNNQFFC